MLHLKRIPHKLCETISRLTLRIHNDYMLHGHVPPSYRLVDMIGMMLYSLTLLGLTVIFLVATCISSLWFVLMTMWMRLQELYQIIELSVLQRRFTSWLSAVQQTVTLKMEKVLQTWHLKKAIVTPPDSTLTSLETPGELKDKKDSTSGIHLFPEPKVEEDLADKLRKVGL